MPWRRSVLLQQNVIMLRCLYDATTNLNVKSLFLQYTYIVIAPSCAGNNNPALQSASWLCLPTCVNEGKAIVMWVFIYASLWQWLTSFPDRGVFVHVCSFIPRRNEKKKFIKQMSYVVEHVCCYSSYPNTHPSSSFFLIYNMLGVVHSANLGEVKNGINHHSSACSNPKGGGGTHRETFFVHTAQTKYSNPWCGERKRL